MTLLPYAAHDVVSTAVLADHGLHSHDVERLCRAGELQPLVRGWFATRAPTSREDRHDLLTRALLNHFDGRAGSSHHSRLITLGLPTWRADLDTGHLVRVGDRGSRTRRGYVLHPAVEGVQLVATAHGPAVPVAVAVVQTGLLNGPMDALIAADAALFRELTTPGELTAAATLFAGRRGVGPVRAALRHADARHESPGETRLAHAMRALGIRSTPQVWVGTALGRKRVDRLVDDDSVVVEFDGRVKYVTDPGGTRSRGDPLFDEKRREDAIRDEVYEFVRVTWSELDDVGAIGRRVEAARRRAGRRVARSA